MKLTTILTERQAEIFMLIVQRYSQREIAKKLKVSDAVVSKVLHKVYGKLEARNAVEAINECLSHGLLSVKDLRRKGEGEDDYSEEDDTNGRLIAAAPEMYKLLTAVANYKPDIIWDVVFHAKELLLRIDGEEAKHE